MREYHRAPDHDGEHEGHGLERSGLADEQRLEDILANNADDAGHKEGQTDLPEVVQSGAEDAEVDAQETAEGADAEAITEAVGRRCVAAKGGVRGGGGVLRRGAAAPPRW